jgi:tetratricopeptide (TPR) repeat protein
MTRRFGLILRFGFFLALAAPDLIAATNDPDKDPALPKRLEEARRLIDTKKPEAAIEKCDKIIALFNAHYANSEHKIYCARTSSEELGYLVKAGADMNEGKFDKGKKDAVVLSSTLSGAYFLKSYALQDLGKITEAKAAILSAVELSPWSSLYLCELGSVYKLKKDWIRAKEAFETAEGDAPLAPDNLKEAELALARRGVGYVLVELGQLDEAEKKYLQCLKDDPNDKKAAAELEYVRNLKAKTKS